MPLAARNTAKLLPRPAGDVSASAHGMMPRFLAPAAPAWPVTPGAAVKSRLAIPPPGAAVPSAVPRNKAVAPAVRTRVKPLPVALP